jgi:phage gp46-like protein
MGMNDPYGGDPLIIDLGDGGDLYIQGGQPKMSSGLENAAYLSLFVDANWWGNDIDPSNPGATGSRHFLPLIDRMALTPSALGDMEKAAKADLAWMVEDGLLSEEAEVVCSILAVGVAGIEMTFTEPDGSVSVTRWKLNWARISEEVA